MRLCNPFYYRCVHRLGILVSMNMVGCELFLWYTNLVHVGSILADLLHTIMSDQVDLSDRYWGAFLTCGLLCAVLLFVARTNQSKANSLSHGANNERFSAFQSTYLLVFLLAMFSDWLQGPYVYELYVSYGFSQAQIAELFVGGYASSMFVGTFVGGMADQLGRKTMCIVYCIFYMLACITKLFPNYHILLLGRFLSGVSTSLLYSVFESWMVCEHYKQGFDGSLLSDTFAYATFGNGLVAVLAGLIANFAAHSFGFVAPFAIAIVPLSVVAVTVKLRWSENHGNHQQNMLSSLTKGFDLIRSDSRIAALGFGQSCFEGAMYTFVFMWTPALKSANEVTAEISGTEDPRQSTSTYLGLIFATFMVCVMIGSSLFKLMSAQKDMLYKIPLYLHATAFTAMVTITLFLEHKLIVFAMFLVFECTVGVFYPSYGVIKSEKIPEDIRSAVMNIFRIPLNAFVVLLLLRIKLLSPRIVFFVCTLAHGTAFLCYLYFYSSMRSATKSLAMSVTQAEMERLTDSM